MTITTTYDDSYTRGFAGQLTERGEKRLIGRISEESSAEIEFGLMVAEGTDPDQQALLVAALTDRIVGITCHRHNENGYYEAGEQMQLLAEGGDIFVNSETAVTKGDPVFVRVTAGASEYAGAFRNDSDSGDARRVPNVYFDETIAAAGIAKVRIDGEIDALPDLEVIAELDNASLTADLTVKVAHTDDDEHILIERAVYNNPTGLAEDAANFFNIKVQHGATPTVAANHSTETGEEGSIAADTPTDLELAAAASRMVPPDTDIEVMFDETGTATLPAGKIQILGRRY